MNNKERTDFAKAISFKNDTMEMSIPATPESKSPDRKETRVYEEYNFLRQGNPAKYREKVVSADKLQEAIIWSEILGQPVSKRRKRR